jgi:hypothetical protein
MHGTDGLKNGNALPFSDTTKELARIASRTLEAKTITGRVYE